MNACDCFKIVYDAQDPSGTRMTVGQDGSVRCRVLGLHEKCWHIDTSGPQHVTRRIKKESA